MSEILHIEGLRMDLTPNTINRTLQINDVGEVKDRQSNFSNTTKLPKTPVNVKNFKFLGVSGNSSTHPYRKLRCDYSVNGIPLISNGYAVVKGANSHYEVVFYDGIIDLSERIKGKKINELNFSDINHYLTQSTYENSFSKTEGYIYALGEFINRSSFTTIKINEQAPSVFVKTIWDKIWEESGLRYTGAFFTENNDFNSEVIAPKNGYTVENIALNSTLLGEAQTNVLSRTVFSNDPLLRFEDQHTFTTGNYIGITKNEDGSLVINEDLQLKLNITTNYSNNGSYINLRIRVNGNVKAFIVLEEANTLKETEINISLKAGDVITFVLVGTYASDQPDSQLTNYYVDYSASSIIEISELSGGQFIDFATFTSDMDQINFVKDVMQRYGLILKPIKNTNSYEFIELEKMLNNKTGAEDWSNKLVTLNGENYGIQYAKKNLATYSYPDEIIQRDFDGELIIDNENAAPSKPLFSSPYEIANKRLRLFKGLVVYQNHIWEEKEEDGEMIIANKETPVKIFRISKVDTSIDTRLFDNVNSITVTGLIPFLSLKNMEMQYFLNVYYKAFQLLINRAKQVDAVVNLNEIDIYNLDFFTLKYLKQTGKYYYLNNVKYSSGRLSSPELIEINGFSENLPPTVLGVFETNLAFNDSKIITVQNITDQSNPTYFDPEFDEPAAIMITGGFNSNILFKNGANVITTQTEILVEDWNVTIQDAGNTTAQHTASFTFKIKDAGSGKYSEVEGSINVTVAQFVNQAPFADAGADKLLTIDTSVSGGSYSTELNASGSFDNTGNISTYDWVKLTGPTGGTITNTDNTTPTAQFIVTNEVGSVGTYEIQLTVTDEFGLSDTDIIIITVNDANTTVNG